MHKVLSITIITVLSVVFLCSGISADDSPRWITDEFGKEDGKEYEFFESLDLSFDAAFSGLIIIGSVTTLGITTALTIHNIYALRSDNPNKFVGIFGTVWGGVTVAYGGALIHSSDDKYIAIGVGAIALGVTSVYYGVKSLTRVRSKYLESKEHGLSIDPVIIGLDRGKADVGIQISLTF